jgi:non-ribosomal peptide synthetase component E (peptide arylation enzyme)
VGRVVSGCECEIRDADGKPLPAGQPGEVVWRGADKSWGYLGDDDETAATFTRDGFYKSGDVGVFDEDGYLRIVGRIKDMILRGGRNISPRTIEDLLIQHPAVVEVAVAAMPDPTLGERACAFVMLRPGARLAFEEMVAFLKEQEIAIWQLPERLEIVSDFPRGAGGKIVKKQLTAMVTEKLEAEKQSCVS